MKNLFLFYLALAFSASVYGQTAPEPVPAGDVGYEIVSPGDVTAPDVPEVVLGNYAEVLEMDSLKEAEAPVDDGGGGNVLFGLFGTFAALAAFIPVAVQFLKKLILPKITGGGAQLFSWGIGLAIVMAGWLLHLGFLDGLIWWQALLYGLGACLAANGIFDTGIAECIVGVFLKKKS
jgi:hypothetical protein